MKDICQAIRNVGFDGVRSAFYRMGYRFFLAGTYDVNIFGVRSSNRTANYFDDAICVAYKDSFYKEHLDVYEATTDPGTTTLKTPSNPKGTAILVPGQYLRVYSVGIHGKGRAIEHEALCQRNGVVSVYRDRNRDNVLDMDASTIDTGYFGINIHRASRYSEMLEVGAYSAGCQVFKSPTEFKKFMTTITLSKSMYGNKFTYTLFTEEQFFGNS